MKDRKLTDKIQTARAALADATERAEEAQREYLSLAAVRGRQAADGQPSIGVFDVLKPELAWVRARVDQERLSRELGSLEHLQSLRDGNDDAAAADLELLASDMETSLGEAEKLRAEASRLAQTPGATERAEELGALNHRAEAFEAAAEGRGKLAQHAWRRLEALALEIDDVHPQKPPAIPVRRDAIGGEMREPYRWLEFIKSELSKSERQRMPSQDRLDALERECTNIEIAREQQLRELEAREADVARWRAKEEKRAAKAEAAAHDAAVRRQRERAKEFKQSAAERAELVASYRARGDVAPPELPDAGSPSKIDGPPVDRSRGQL